MQNNGLLKEFLTQPSVLRSLAHRVGLKRPISTAVILDDVPASTALTTLNSALFRTNDADSLYEFAA